MCKLANCSNQRAETDEQDDNFVEDIESDIDDPGFSESDTDV